MVPTGKLTSQPGRSALRSLRFLTSSGALSVALLLLTWAATVSAAESIHRFDFGIATNAWPGFVGVGDKTTYSPERGYGWAESASLYVFNDGWPAPLLDDLVSPRRAVFRVDLPNGAYRVWVRRGHFNGGRMFWLHRQQKLLLNGALVFEENVSAKQVFEEGWVRDYATLWRTGMDAYDAFVRPIFDERVFDVAITNGALLAEIQNVPLTAMIIAPDVKTLADEIARLHNDLRRAAPLRYVPERPDEPDLPPSATERRRGFFLFARDRETPLYPNSRPRAEERIQSLETFAAQGETAAVSFGLTPLRELKATSVTVEGLDDLRADVRFVRYSPVIWESGYTARPSVLDHRASLDLERGVTKRYWIRFRIPPDQPAGELRGVIRVAARGQRVTNVPVAVRVLPLRLSAARIHFGAYYLGTEWYTRFFKANVFGTRQFDDDLKLDRITLDALRAHFRFMKEIGYNSVAWKDDLRFSLKFENRHPVIPDDHRFVRWMDEYARAGFGPMPWFGFQPIGTQPSFIRDFFATGYTHLSPDWREAYRNLIVDIETIRKKRGWPEILWYVEDELSNHGQKGGQLGVELAKLTREIPGIRTIASMNGIWEHPIVPHVNIAMPNFAFPITDATVKMIRDAGTELWLYNIGDTRFSFGLYPWALRAGGRFQWEFGAGEPTERWGLAWSSAYGVQKRGPNYEMFPNAIAEAHREGIVDYRYLQALEEAVATARTTKPQQAADAQAFLDQLRASVPVDIRAIALGKDYDPKAGGLPLRSELTGASRLDDVRWEVARHLLALRNSPMTNELNLIDPHKRWRLTVTPERGISELGLDSEGGDRAATNLLLQPANLLVAGRPLAPGQWRTLSRRECETTLAIPGSTSSLRWCVRCEEDGFVFDLSLQGGEVNEELRLSLPMDALRAAATLIPADVDRDNLGLGPWLLVAPDFGHLLVTAESPYAWRGVNDGKRGSLAASGLRGVDPSLRGLDILRAGGVDLSRYKPGEIRLQFLCREPMRAGRILALRFRTTELTTPKGIDTATWKRIRRPYLNHWQPCSTWDDRSRWNVLANNVLSDPASCSLASYSEPMLFWREPVPGIDVAKLLRHSVNYWLDQHVSYFGHVNAFDMGRWKRFDLYLFANPMLVTSAWHYWKLSGDKAWLESRIKLLHRIGEFVARRDVDGDGLVESLQSGNAGTLRQPDRADVWFEMTNFGWKNAYTNALVFRAWRQLAEMLEATGHPGGAARFRQLADKLREAYLAKLLSRDHGWVVSWISADGVVHDYGHIFTSGMAVAYGIIPPEQGRQILEPVVAKSKRIGFRAWHLGVPANLIPVKRADMILPMMSLDGAPMKEPHPLWGWPEELTDEETFGRRYTNGTVHPALVWPYLLGLQTAGLDDEASRIMEAMLGSAEKGLLQNGIIGCMPLGADHFSQDGATCGFEGYLPENFNVLMACFTRDPSNRRRLLAQDPSVR